MLKSGTKPGNGTYKCTKCGHVIQLSNENDELPVCPKCKHDEWRKIG